MLGPIYADIGERLSNLPGKARVMSYYPMLECYSSPSFDHWMSFSGGRDSRHRPVLKRVYIQFTIFNESGIKTAVVLLFFCSCNFMKCQSAEVSNGQQQFNSMKISAATVHYQI